MRLLPLLLLASSLFASSRPLVDDKRLVTLAPRSGGFDAYWIHRNELAPVVTTRLLRTPLTLDGKIAGPTVLLREDEGYVASGVAGPLVFHAGIDRVLYVNDKVIARGVERPNVLCGLTLCAAVWSGHAQFLDREANPIGAPIALAGDALSMRMVDDDLVIVRTTGNETRATRLGLGGAIRYDVMLHARAVASSEPPSVAISHDGARTVFAFVETPWMPAQRVRAVAIDAHGAAEQLGSLCDDVRGPVALVWDGARHQLFTPTSFGVPLTAVANGGHIAVSWSGFRPTISVYANGTMTAPVELDEPARRRTVGR